MTNRFLLMLLSCLLAANSFAVEENLERYYMDFKEVFENVNRHYVNKPDKKKMIESALKGMLQELDPHSTFMNKDEFNDFSEQTRGEFGGVGIEIVPENSLIKIISPIDDLPAARAGVQPGDYITAVNDESISNLDYMKAVHKMRGAPGTKVKLTIARPGESKPIDLELIREIVKIHAVKSNLDNKVAYVRISSFNENTSSELKKAVREMTKEAGGELKGIILDLRNNPGGLLKQAVEVSEYFLEKGVIVTTKGRHNSNNMSFSASSFSSKAPKVPVVVIINSGSASASEIVAGALQDNKRAVIIGTESFGKGSVQTMIPILDGAMKITTAIYYTPSLRSIQAEGIKPDIIVEATKVEYNKATGDEKKYSESSLKNHIKNDNGNSKSNSDSSSKIALSKLYISDYQYARAYDLVMGLSVAKNIISD